MSFSKMLNFIQTMEQRALKILNNCLNTNVYHYLETSGGRCSNLYLNVVHSFNTSVNQTSVAASDRCFRALVPLTCCFIMVIMCQVSWGIFHKHFFRVLYDHSKIRCTVLPLFVLLSVINLFSRNLRIFVISYNVFRLGLKHLPGTNALAYYKNS